MTSTPSSFRTTRANALMRAAQSAFTAGAAPPPPPSQNGELSPPLTPPPSPHAHTTVPHIIITEATPPSDDAPTPSRKTAKRGKGGAGGRRKRAKATDKSKKKNKKCNSSTFRLNADDNTDGSDDFELLTHITPNLEQNAQCTDTACGYKGLDACPLGCDGLPIDSDPDLFCHEKFSPPTPEELFEKFSLKTTSPPPLGDHLDFDFESEIHHPTLNDGEDKDEKKKGVCYSPTSSPLHAILSSGEPSPICLPPPMLTFHRSVLRAHIDERIQRYAADEEENKGVTQIERVLKKARFWVDGQYNASIDLTGADIVTDAPIGWLLTHQLDKALNKIEEQNRELTSIEESCFECIESMAKSTKAYHELLRDMQSQQEKYDVLARNESQLWKSFSKQQDAWELRRSDLEATITSKERELAKVKEDAVDEKMDMQRRMRRGYDKALSIVKEQMTKELVTARAETDVKHDECFNLKQQIAKLEKELFDAKKK